MELLLTQSAEYYLRLARESFRLNDPLGARMAYFLSIESWKRASKLSPLFLGHLNAVEEEYRWFDRFDPVYKNILRDLQEIVSRSPQIAQTALIQQLAHYHQRDVEYSLYFALKDGKILFQRDGDEYLLHLPRNRETAVATQVSAHKMFIRFSRN